MIRYAINCDAGHRFEAWFASAGSFDQQRESEADCMPGVRQHRRREGADGAGRRGLRASRRPARLAAHAPTEVAEAIRTIRKHLTDNAEYVGDRFAAEARKIHFEEAEKRGIYGEANAQDVRGLIEDGIEFHPLPTLPEDHN